MRTVSVYDLVHYLKNTLDSDKRIQNILVSGEISNLTNHFSGHLYFTLKDDKAKISCVMFRSSASKLLFIPKNGDHVVIRCNISVFEATGQMQAYALEMKPDGIGELYLRYEELKRKLADAGYFSEEHKIKVTSYPMHVAILCGDRSAALSDIMTCFKRRWPICHYDIYPVLVQGEGSAKDIIDTLKIVDDKDYDAIILARGGGSLEDIWSFNDEGLAKTIYELKTFIVTGIGHEQDFTIADFVADLRAPTPTAAVELITPNIKDILVDIKDYHKRLKVAFDRRLKSAKTDLETIKGSIIFKEPSYIIKKQAQYFDNLSLRMINHEVRLKDMNKQISLKIISIAHALHLRLDRVTNLLENKEELMKRVIDQRKIDKELLLKRYETLLRAYSHEKTLERGFSIVMKDDKVLKDVSDLKIQDEIEIRLYKGTLKAEIKEIKDGKV